MKKKPPISNTEILTILNEVESAATSGNIPYLISKDASLEDHLKHSICRLFVMYLHRKKIRPIDLHELIDIPKTRISNVVNYRITNYSLDRLFSYAERLANIDPQTREHLALMIDILDGPVRTVSKSKQLKQDIRRFA